MLSFIAAVLLLGSPEKAFDLMQVPEAFSKQLIATEPQVMDPVAFCFDDDGNILVAESFRQEQGVEDNRSSSFWLDWDIALQSVDERLYMYKHFADQRKNGTKFAFRCQNSQTQKCTKSQFRRQRIGLQTVIYQLF